MSKYKEELALYHPDRYDTCEIFDLPRLVDESTLLPIYIAPTNSEIADMIHAKVNSMAYEEVHIFESDKEILVSCMSLSEDDIEGLKTLIQCHHKKSVVVSRNTDILANLAKKFPQVAI